MNKVGMKEIHGNDENNPIVMHSATKQIQILHDWILDFITGFKLTYIQNWLHNNLRLNFLDSLQSDVDGCYCRAILIVTDFHWLCTMKPLILALTTINESK